MSLLLWLKDLPWMVVVRENSWLYASIQTVHAIGMGLLVGTLTIINLRLLGFLKPLPVYILVKLLGIIWTGFALNAASGLLMFLADGPKLVGNWIFLLKMALILCGFVIALLSRSVVYANMRKWTEGQAIPGSARLLACVSLVVWYGAIAAGRLTAFLLN